VTTEATWGWTNSGSRPIRTSCPPAVRHRPKAYNLYTADEARAFLGCVRGVTNERQARRTFAAEARDAGEPAGAGSRVPAPEFQAPETPAPETPAP
jgi:hypothetical protein